MATTTSITTTYAGEFKDKIIAAALLSGSTIENGGIEVKPSIKYKEVIKKLSTDAILKNSTCDFSATSTVTLTERILQVEDLQVNLQLCKKDFHSDFLSAQQGYSSYDVLPTSFQDFLMAHVASKVAAKIESNIWMGVDSNQGEFSGLATIASLDAGLPAAQEIAAVSGGITSANVIAELDKIVSAIPDAVYSKDDLYIYVSNKIAKAYISALGGFGASGLGANGTNAQGTQWYNNGSLSFSGVKIFVANGLTDDRAIAAEKSNLFFGCGLLTDMTEAKVLDMADLDGSQNVRVILRMSAGVQIGVIEDIVTYGITNAAN